MIEPLLMTTVRVNTFDEERPLTNATGFFFERDGRLFLVTSRHVLFDADSKHAPSRLVIDIHVDADDLAVTTGYSIPLYREGRGLWRDGADRAGAVDVAAVEIDRSAFPAGAQVAAFTPAHLVRPDQRVEIGSTLLTVGYPLGFHDSLHSLPVARQASLASSFGLRFQGLGYFLVDARTHRGISGAPVVMRGEGPGDALPWRLLGVHAARLEAGGRDPELDETLGLNAAWYADILMAFTAP